MFDDIDVHILDKPVQPVSRNWSDQIETGLADCETGLTRFPTENAKLVIDASNLDAAEFSIWDRLFVAYQ